MAIPFGFRDIWYTVHCTLIMSKRRYSGVNSEYLVENLLGFGQIIDALRSAFFFFEGDSRILLGFIHVLLCKNCVRSCAQQKSRDYAVSRKCVLLLLMPLSSRFCANE